MLSSLSEIKLIPFEAFPPMFFTSEPSALKIRIFSDWFCFAYTLKVALLVTGCGYTIGKMAVELSGTLIANMGEYRNELLLSIILSL